MQIQFDPRDRNACAGVLAMINGLHGAAAFNDAFPDANKFWQPVAFDPEHHAAVEAGQVDASEAFDAPDPAAAFPPVPFASPAATADTAAAPAGSTATPTLAPAPGSPAPTPPNAATPNASGASPAVETDKHGLPWDARIHAGKANDKKKVADGSWRKRRGVDDTTVAAVEAELRQIMAAPGPNATAPAAPAPTDATTPPAAPPHAAVSEPSAVVSPPPPAAVSQEPAPAQAPTVAPVAPPPTPAAVGTAPGPVGATTAPSPVPLTLPVLMRKITALQSAGSLTVADTNAVAVSLGLTSVRDLVQRPDLIESFDALLPEQAVA